MGGAAAVRGARSRLATAAVVATAALLGMLLAASSARATELVFWENPLQNTIGVVNGGDNGAVLLNTTGAAIDAPEGISYDPVTNRLYVASEGLSADGNISYVNLNGSGGGPLPLPPTMPAVKDPRGVVVDPVGRIAYWLNNTDSGPESILWARLDGSEGGELPLGGQPLLGTVRLAVDPPDGLLFWGNSDGSFHYAPLIGHGGTAGELEAKANGKGSNITGLAVDTAFSRIFWVEFASNAVWTAGLSGTSKSEVVQGVSAATNQPAGLAFDVLLSRLHWANSGVENSTTAALGFADLGSPAVAITPVGAPANLPQDALVLKTPTNLAPPAINAQGAQLNCVQGYWAPDFASSFVYQAPSSFSYQWTLNDAPIAGASGATFTASASGRYKCVVTASNAIGATSRTSSGITLTLVPTSRKGSTVIREASGTQGPKPADLHLLGKARHLESHPGNQLTLKVRTSNEGAAASKPAKLCLKLTKGAEEALRAGKCRDLGALAGGATATAKLRLRVKAAAEPGLYKLQIAVPGDQIKVTVRVLG